MTWFAFLGALEQGFVYGIMVLGVYLTFRVLDFPDLTVDGSLPLGAAVAAVAITRGVNPFLALLFAAGAGFLAGMVTALLNTKLKILHLLASILTMIALYSINIRIMQGPNISLLGVTTVLDPFASLGIPGYIAAPVFFGIVAAIITLASIPRVKLDQPSAMAARDQLQSGMIRIKLTGEQVVQRTFVGIDGGGVPEAAIVPDELRDLPRVPAGIELDARLSGVDIGDRDAADLARVTGDFGSAGIGIIIMGSVEDDFSPVVLDRQEFLQRYILRHDDRCINTQAPGGPCHSLGMVAGGSRDDPP